MRLEGRVFVIAGGPVTRGATLAAVRLPVRSARRLEPTPFERPAIPLASNA